MMLSKSRRKELEEQWEREKRKRASARVSLVEVPADMMDMRSLCGGLERPKGLRRTDLVQGLARLALEWSDRRFAQCVRALFELGIVNKKGHFTKKRGSHAHLIDKPDDTEVAARVMALMDRGLSEREASALVARDLGWKANSFEAASEQVRNASRRVRNASRPARKTVGWRARG
jgi:hypothetical protein